MTYHQPRLLEVLFHAAAGLTVVGAAVAVLSQPALSAEVNPEVANCHQYAVFANEAARGHDDGVPLTDWRAASTPRGHKALDLVHSVYSEDVRLEADTRYSLVLGLCLGAGDWPHE